MKTKTDEPKSSIILMPSALTLSSNNWTANQWKYILRMFANIQQEIKEIISQKAQHGQIVPTMFVRNGDLARVEVPFRNLESSESHYPDLESDLKKISSMPFAIPYKMRKPRDPDKWQVAWKQLPCIFCYKRSQKKNRKRYAEFDILPEVIEYVFPMDFGYHRINLDLMFSLLHFATRKLYDLMEGSVKINMRKFQPRMLYGLLTSNGTYAGYGNLEYHQLSVAERELKGAFDNGLCDSYLTHERIDVINKFVDNTISVVFHLHSRGDGSDGKSKPASPNHLLDYQTRIKSRLSYQFGVDEKVAKDIASKIKENQVPRVDATLTEDYQMRDKLRNLAGFVVSEMKKIIE